MEEKNSHVLEEPESLLVYGEKAEAEAAWKILTTYMEAFTPEHPEGKQIMLHAIMLVSRNRRQLSLDKLHKVLDFSTKWKDLYSDDDLYQNQREFAIKKINEELIHRATPNVK